MSRSTMVKTASEKKGAKKKNTKSTVENETDLDVLPDDSWNDIEALGHTCDYIYLKGPRKFGDAMIADKHNWLGSASECQETKRMVHPIVNCITNIVMPRIADINYWRDHVSDHLARTCARRRKIEPVIMVSIKELESKTDRLVNANASIIARVDALCDKIAVLDKAQNQMLGSMCDLYENKEALPQRKKSAEDPATQERKEAKRESSPKIANRGIFKETYASQLMAVASRSQSPIRDTLRLIHQLGIPTQRRLAREDLAEYNTNTC